MGGEDLECLLLQENPIIAYEKGWNLDNYELALLEILDPGYENYTKGISLFSGYNTDGVHLRLLEAIKRSYDPSLIMLRAKLENSNYFCFEKDILRLLNPHIRKLEGFIEKDRILYRSRIGFESRAIPLGGWGDTWHYQPYSKKQISAPAPFSAVGGRLNRVGVSYLYLSTEQETAISEVRPHPGHYVTVGEFLCQTRLRIADFSAISLRGYTRSDQKLDQFLFLKTIDELFSLPVPPEEFGRYSFTQFLSDAIRHIGFEGISYKSSVGKGVNLVIFNPESFSYVEGSAKVLHVDNLKYCYSTLTPFKFDGDYLTDLDGNHLQ